MCWEAIYVQREMVLSQCNKILVRMEIGLLELYYQLSILLLWFFIFSLFTMEGMEMEKV